MNHDLSFDSSLSYSAVEIQGIFAEAGMGNGLLGARRVGISGRSRD
jgi:hypothetical protein